MPIDRFFIAPYDTNSGMQTNVRPWLIPDEAFAELTNAYVFRGRVRKRFGSRYLGTDAPSSRLRFTAATYATGSATGTVPDAPWPIGTAFSILGVFFTVNVTGTPANLLIANGSAVAATFNTTSGAFVFTTVLDSGGNPIPDNTPVYFYPSLPVMGLLTFYDNTQLNEPTIAFDTSYAYQYIANTGWDRLAAEATGGAATWTGDNSQFFWGATWGGTTPSASNSVFYVTNFNQNEPNFMRYLLNNTWNNFNPTVSNLVVGPPLILGITLVSGLIIVPFKNRLVVLNTWESETADGMTFTLNNYPARARYSQAGSPLATTGWRQDIQGLGNAVDASTTEAIVSVEFIKDRLIVFFEQSTWELVYTGNQAYPFVWQQLNTELGAESTFSIVAFDKVVLGVGNVGIMACNGSNVERIDDKIPDEVFNIHNADEGIYRVYGIRDYFVEMTYWTFPSTDASSTFPYPNRVLVYNYKTGTWAFNDDSITAFGYFQPQSSITWDSLTVTWDDDESWDNGSTQALFRQVIAGNQEGFTFICDAEETTNALVLQITDISTNVMTPNIITFTVIDHNLREGDYIYFNGITASSGNLTLLNNTIFPVINSGSNTITATQFSIVYSDVPGNIITGTYSGGGLISRVSNINILTKQYNFYAKSGRNAYVSKIDFMVDSTAAGQIQVDYYVSTAQDPLTQESVLNGSILGTGTLDTFPYNNAAAPVPYEANATRLWHPVYFQADGEVVQFELSMNDAQMRNVNIMDSDFQMHAMCIYATPTSYRFQ
jgi:hypothetical protein